jgi:hypothetical protein
MFKSAEIGLADIHKFFSKVIEEVDTQGKAELSGLVADVKAAIEQAKVDVLNQVANASPDIQAAVQKTLGAIEQAVLAAIAARLGV